MNKKAIFALTFTLFFVVAFSVNTWAADCMDVDKKVRPLGSAEPFQDADTADEAVLITDGAEYQITISNCGTGNLWQMVLNDPELGLVDYSLGDLVIWVGDPPYTLTFEKPGPCEEISPVNTVTVSGLSCWNPIEGTDSAYVKCPEEEGLCWATAGGVKFDSVTKLHLAEHGPRDSCGGVAFPSCSLEPSEGCQWNHVAHSLKLHFQGWSCEFVECGNVEGIDPGSESPVTPFNYIEFYVTNGTLKGIHGNKVDYGEVSAFIRLEDHNEPGNEHAANAGADIDRYFLEVFDSDGNTLLLIADENGDPITITGGNFQIHKCQN